MSNSSKEIDHNRLPIYLFADSQLLFWQADNGKYFLQEELNRVNVIVKHAVYIGAANDDVPEYFELFRSAMETIGSPVCHFLKSNSNIDYAKDLLQQADLILLAGGNVNLGWQFIKQLKSVLACCYFQRKMLIGISAGAIHLSALGWLEKDTLYENDLFATIGLVPYVIGVHDEANNWDHLKQVMKLTEGCFSGLGIPFGGGVAIEHGGHIKGLRKPIIVFEYDGNLSHSSLLPA